MTATVAPDIALSLTWQGGQRFEGKFGDLSLTLDGKRAAGPSPVQGVAFALAGCMGIDVVNILEKGRQPLKALSCDMNVFREAEAPKKITGIELHFTVTGEIDADRVSRAIALSREKYCSVWHSLNPAIDFKTTFTVHP